MDANLIVPSTEFRSDVGGQKARVAARNVDFGIFNVEQAIQNIDEFAH